MSAPEIEFPVKMDENFTLVDADGKTVIPCFIWRADVQHLDRQKKLGALVVHLLNEWHAGPKEGAQAPAVTGKRPKERSHAA
mgnify:CR=1 FL=1